MYDYTPYTHCESVTPRHCVFDWGIRQPTEAESDSGTRTQDTEAEPEQVAEATHSVEGEQQAAVPPVNLGQPKCPSKEELAIEVASSSDSNLVIVRAGLTSLGESVYLSRCLSVYLSIYVSIYLSIYLSR